MTVVRVTLQALPDDDTMLTRAKVAEKHGLSERQVRYRLSQLDNLIDKHLVTTDSGHVALDNDGLTIFDRLMQLEADGLSLATAVSQLHSELDEPHENGVNGDVSSCPGCVAKDQLISELRDQVKWLRSRIEILERRNEELEQRALPGPKRGPLAWLGDLFKANGAH